MTKMYRNIFSNGAQYSFGAPLTNSVVSFLSHELSTSDWLTVYSVDFTTLPTGSVYGDGLIAINNVAWDRKNSANAEYMSYSANGLNIKVNKNPSEMYGISWTGPHFVLPLGNVFTSSYYHLGSVPDFDLRIVCQASGSNLNALHEGIGIGIELSTSLASKTNVFLARDFDVNLNNLVITTINNSSAYTPFSVTNPYQSLFVFEITDQNRIMCSLGTTSTPSSSFDPNGNLSQTMFSNTNFGTNNFSHDSSPIYYHYKDLNFFCSVDNSGNNGEPSDASLQVFRLYVQVKPK